MQKNLFRVSLDAVMLIVYCILVFGFGTSMLFHELAGMAIGVLFLVHVWLNRRMFRGLRAQARGQQPTLRQRILPVLDIVLALAMLVTVVTGVLIARQTFNFNLGSVKHLLSGVHKLAAMTGLGILAVHTLMHLRFLGGVFRNLAAAARERKLLKPVVRVGAGLLAAGILFSRVYLTMRSQEDTLQTAQAAVTTQKDAYAETTAVTDTIDDGSGTTASVSDGSTTSSDASGSTSSSDSSGSSGSSSSSGSKSGTSDSTGTQSSGASDTTAPTLDQFLGKLFCTGCHNHCCLLSPRCGRGEEKAEQAQVEYAAEYGDSTT